jgi:transketolase
VPETDIERLTRASLPADWSDLDTRAVDTVRVLAADAVQKVAAGIAMPWHRFTGDLGENVAIEHFGASADYQTLFRELGFTTTTTTTDDVVAAARRSFAKTS